MDFKPLIIEALATGTHHTLQEMNWIVGQTTNSVQGLPEALAELVAEGRVEDAGDGWYKIVAIRKPEQGRLFG